MKKTNAVLAATVVVGIAAALSACSPDSGGKGSSNTATTCTNKIVHADAPRVTMWAWYPDFEKVVDMFNTDNTDVQICWSEAGVGATQYSKFSAAIESGRGGPDVLMVEAEYIPSFVIRDALVDLTKYGANDVKDNYSKGSWKSVSSGDAVYAIPVDAGPMGLTYRKDIFDSYGLTVPTTWAEYEETGQKLKDAGGPLMGDFPSNKPPLLVAYMQQLGSVPFEYDASEPTKIGINLNGEAEKQVWNYWQGLVKKGLVGTQDHSTSDFITGLGEGHYATYPSAAWGAKFLAPLEGDGVWQAAPLPQWDASKPVQVNWGGSTFAVAAASDKPELAAKVAMGLYQSAEQERFSVEAQASFPTQTSVLEADWFRDLKVPVFSGQQTNKDVYVPAAVETSGTVYSPFTQYFYDQVQKQTVKLITGEVTGDEVADNLQKAMVAYAKEQGFTVTK